MAHVAGDYSLYYDAVNEKGLGMAGLNFVGNAVYAKPCDDGCNVAQYEFIPWMLSQCQNLEEAKKLLKETTLTGTPFSEQLPAAQLHWIIADQSGAITVEAVEEGLKVYDNPVGVLTNNPPFDYHKINLSNYMHITNREIQNNILKSADLEIYGKGMGAISLPGDSSPASRFIKATFLLNNIDFTSDNDFNIQQMFHVLNNVSSLKGEIILNDESREYTVYSDIYDTKNKTVYIRSYEDSTIEKHFLTEEEENSAELLSFKVSHQPSYKNI